MEMNLLIAYIGIAIMVGLWVLAVAVWALRHAL